MLQISEVNRFHRSIGRALAIIVVLTLIAIAAYAYLFYQGQKADDTIVYKSRLQIEARTFTDKLILEIENIKHTPANEAAEGQLNSSRGAIATDNTEEVSSADDQAKSVLLKQLKDGYAKVLIEQKNEALRQLEALIGMAKADWAEQVASQETTKEHKEKLFSEYLAKVNVLEAQMDASFEELLTKMTEQLEAEGFDPESVIKGFRAEYEQVKRENRNEMMSKAIDAIKQN